MRPRAALLLLALVALALALTNPTTDDYLRWFERRTEAASQGLDDLSRLSLLERTLEVRATLRRENYLLFSVFRVEVMRREHAFVGVLGRFAGLGDARRAVPGS